MLNFAAVRADRFGGAVIFFVEYFHPYFKTYDYPDAARKNYQAPGQNGEMISLGWFCMNKQEADDLRHDILKMKRTIDATLFNMEAAEEMLARADGETAGQLLRAKNERRRQMLAGLRSQILDNNSQRNDGGNLK